MPAVHWILPTPMRRVFRSVSIAHVQSPEADGSHVLPYQTFYKSDFDQVERNHHKLERRTVERDATATVELMRLSIWRGDERPVEALRHGCRCTVIGERPRAGERGVRGNRRPVWEGQAWAGLQRHEKIRRGVEDDSCGAGRLGDAGKDGGFRRWQFADIAVEGNSGSERQGSAVHRAGGVHSNGLISYNGPLEHRERPNNR